MKKISFFLGLLFAPLAFALDVARIVPVSSVTATSTSQELNITGYTGFAEATFQSLNTAGTSPTLAAKLQGSDVPTIGYAYLTAGTTVNKLRAGATTTVKLGAKFTQSGTRSVKTVTLMLKKLGTITSGKLLTLDVDTDSSGVPSDTSIGTSGTVGTDSVSTTDYVPVVFTFTKPVDVTDATVYHFVLSGDYTASTSNCIVWRSNTVASGGTQTTNDATNWTAVTTESFEVYVGSQYAFTDITGGGFTSVTTGASALSRVRLYAPDQPAYIRIAYTVGGTGGPTYYVSGLWCGNKASP